MIKLDELVWFQEGPGVRNYQYTSSGVKLINVTNLTGKDLDLSLTDRFISSEEAYGKYKHFLCESGDLLIASSGITYESIPNKVSFVRECDLPLCMNTSVIRFKTLDKNKLIINYLYYFFKSNSYRKQIARLMTGSAQLNYGPAHLHKVLFKDISLEEQKRRVLILDKIDKLIAESKTEIGFCDELIKSRFIEMFGDVEEKELIQTACNRVTDFVASGSFASLRENVKYFNEENYAILVKTADFANNFTKGLTYTDKHGYDFLKNSNLFGGELILPNIGASIGKAFIVPKLDKPMTLAPNSIMIEPSNNYLTEYLYYYFLSDYGQKQLIGMTTATAMPKFNKTQLKALLIIAPSFEEQRKFVDFTKCVEKTKSIIQKRLFYLTELFNKKMDEYFGDND